MNNDPTNADRAEFATQAIEAVPGKYGVVDEDAITDLISDLLHLAKKLGYAEAGVLLDRARMNFDAEINEET
jgi:hypothetical protein